jgi:hypothetical protein
MPPVELKSLVLDIVERVTIAVNRIDIWLNRAKIAAALEAGGGSQRPDIDPITLSIEAKLRRAGKGKRLVIENGAVAEVNEGLVELRSFRDPKPVPLWIGRQHRGHERTPRNEQVPANLPHSTFSPRAGNCRRSSRRSTSHRADPEPAAATEQKPAA